MVMRVNFVAKKLTMSISQLTIIAIAHQKKKKMKLMKLINEIPITFNL